MYQFGPLLPAGPRQHVDCGLGKAIPLSPPGLIAPTEDITYTGEELIVDGVRIVFQLTPETEAPAEMNFFFPDRVDGGGGWLCMAENCSHNMHNLIPIRGAQARNSLAWSKYIDEAIDLFGDDTRSCSPRTTGRAGALTTSRGSSARSATCTATCTTRRCATPITGTPRSRSPT